MQPPVRLLLFILILLSSHPKIMYASHIGGGVHIIIPIMGSYYNTYSCPQTPKSRTTMTTRRLITSLLAYNGKTYKKKKTRYSNKYIYTKEAQRVQFACIYPLPTLLLVTRGECARSRVQCVYDCVFHGGRSTLVTTAAASSPKPQPLNNTSQ